MKEFLYLFRGGQNPGASPETMQQDMMKWKVWMDNLIASGRSNGGQPLTYEGKTMYDGGKKIVDGPFVEGKEVIGGYVLVIANDYNEAVELARDCPIFDYNGSVEVREIRQQQM